MTLKAASLLARLYFFFGNPQNSVILVGVLSSRGKNHTRGIPLILLQLDIEDGEF